MLGVVVQHGTDYGAARLLVPGGVRSAVSTDPNFGPGRSGAQLTESPENPGRFTQPQGQGREQAGAGPNVVFGSLDGVYRRAVVGNELQSLCQFGRPGQQERGGLDGHIAPFLP